MELQAVSTPANTVAAYAGQQQPARPATVNEVAQQREREDARSRLEDRVTLSPDARQADPRAAQPQDTVLATGNAQGQPANPSPDQAARATRAEDNGPRNGQQSQAQSQAQNQIQNQNQAGNNPPPQPASVVRALEAYSQTSLV